MGGVQIEVRDQEVTDALKGLLLRARNLRPAMTQIGGQLVTSTQHRFEHQKGPDGQPWKPLAFPTLLGRAGEGAVKERLTIKGQDYVKLTARAERRLGDVKILQVSLRLLKSITFRSDSESVAVGTNVPYARIHQLGGQAGRGRKVTIPARPYLGFDGEDRAAALNVLTRHFGDVP
jgi:phage gpG-like protein